jgi:hypothetical protein
MTFTLLARCGGLRHGAIAPWDDRKSLCQRQFPRRVPCDPPGQNVPADPLNNGIVECRDLMVNLKVFGNRKKRNNFAPILS